MERIVAKYNDLVRLHEALGSSVVRYDEAKHHKNIDETTREERRDSLIKRFELSYDLLWKYLREYISAMHGATIDSPRKVFQQCLQYGITNVDETEQLLRMVESRNLTTHVYNEDLADDVAAKIPKHYQLIHVLITRTKPDNVAN